MMFYRFKNKLLKDKLVVIFFFLLLVFSFLSNYALGYPPNLYAIVINYLILYLLFNANKFLFQILLLVHGLVCVVYIPEAIFYGSPSIGIIASLFETNYSEIIEYLDTLPLYSYAVSFLFFIFVCIILKISTKISSKSLSWRANSIYLFLCLVGVLYKPILHLYKYNEPFSLESSRVSFIGFYALNYKLIKDYHTEKANLENAKHIKDTWNVSNVSPKYTNYVLIIGESMRADYLSLYGYPLNTTPFLSETKGTIIDGYVAAAPNTQTSLLRTLYHFQDENTQYQNNIITLANKAGFNTYWISNQGETGDFDTVTSRVAYYANDHYFTQKLSSNGLGINDKKLLSVLENKLKQDKTKPSLFVLHLMGSHPSFCQRIQNKPTLYLRNKVMSCYLETLIQTDKIIKDIRNLLEEHGSYSLIYFSDHGLSHRGENKSLTLTHDNKYKQNYQVPFIKISSDDEQRNIIKTQRSGFNFIYGFAEWLGIKEKSLDTGYQFFSETTDDVKVFDWNSMIDFNSLKDDPAVVP